MTWVQGPQCPCQFWALLGVISNLDKINLEVDITIPSFIIEGLGHNGCQGTMGLSGILKDP